MTSKGSASTPRPPRADPPIDLAKLRAALRRLGDESVFYILDEAIDALPPAKLAKIVGRYIRLEQLRPDHASSGSQRSLLEEVRAFDAASRRGDYYVSFAVNSQNCMDTSTGTRAFIADFRRLLGRCMAQSSRADAAETREAFDTLVGLLHAIDEGNDDILFFADEGGSWLVGVDWRRVFPTWFRALAWTAQPDEFARVIVQAVDDFTYEARDTWFAAARKVGNAAQRRALDARVASPPRRR